MKEYQYRVCYKRPEEKDIQRYIVDSLEQAEANTEGHNPYAKEWIERREVSYGDWTDLTNQPTAPNLAEEEGMEMDLDKS